MSLYDGSYQRRRKLLVAQGYSDPSSVCWQCRQPLATCGPNRNGQHRNGSPAKWTAGHVIDGDRTSPLELECSPCNYSRGARAGNQRRGRGVAIAATPQPPQDPAIFRLSDSGREASDEAPVGRPSGGRRSPRSRSGKGSGSARGPAVENVAVVAPEALTCTECGREYKTDRGLRAHLDKVHPDRAESPAGQVLVPDHVGDPVAAVETTIATLLVPVQSAWLLATVRRLAEALRDCVPGDAPKITRELSARVAELVAVASPTKEHDDDWTKGSGAPEVRDAT